MPIYNSYSKLPPISVIFQLFKMYYKPNFLVKILAIFYLFKAVSPKVEFTNIKCTSMDPEFSDFEYCYLKSVNRTYKYLSLKLNVFKVPVSEFQLNFAVLKRFNGYRPFLYNITMDACRFLRYPKSNPVVLYMYDLFRPYSNLNHTCPYNHDIIVDKLSTGFINNHVTAVLPVPEGDYCLQTSWSANNILRSMITACGTLS